MERACSNENTNGSFSIDPHDVAIALARSADPAEPTDRTSDEHNDTSHAELIQLHGSDTYPKDDISTKSHGSAFILSASPAIPCHETRRFAGAWGPEGPRPLQLLCIGDSR